MVYSSAKSAVLAPEQEAVTSAAFADYWLSSYPRPAASTRSTYRFAARRFARDFGDQPLATLTRAQAAEWAARHRWAAGAVRAMFTDAVNKGVVKQNPFARLRLPRTRGRRDLVPLSVSDVAELAAVAGRVHPGRYGVTWTAAILLLAWTGVRPGELLALEWQDVGPGTLAVRRSLSQSGELTPPKNGFERVVALPKRAADALLPLQSAGASGRIFVAESGRPLAYWMLLRDWCVIRKRFWKSTVHLYELRHFCASYLLATGVSPKVIALQLGHRDGGQLVLSTYGHLYTDEALRQIRSAVDHPCPGEPDGAR